MVKISEEVIQQLWGLGAERWTKYGYDRLYLQSAGKRLIGLEYKRRSNGGTISEATLNGEMISNKACNRILANLDKCYVDLDAKKLVLPFTDKDNLQELLTNAIDTLYKEIHYGKEN